MSPRDRRILSAGRVLRETEGKIILIKYPTEEELIQIKHLVHEEMKNVK